VEELRALTRPASEVASLCPAFADVVDVVPMQRPRGKWMPVIVQTWLDGDTLENVLARERAPRMSLAKAIEMLTPVADALSYAHARGLVHGSLSPRTLFVRELTGVVGAKAHEGWSAVAILDLGIAQALAATQERLSPFAEPPFGALHFFAPTYRSPEHFKTNASGLVPGSDVFALALIVAEIVSGEAPSPSSARGDFDDDTRIPFRAHRQPVSYVEAVFARALAARASDRFASVSAFWEALRTASRVTALRPSARTSRPAPLSTPESGVRHFAWEGEAPKSVRPPVESTRVAPPAWELDSWARSRG
jgi:serine/threonine-protein kinase